MGVVQLAYDRTACRNVAIKRIRPSYADASFTERFRREYRALAAIEHRGVPAIYDIGETSAGEPYFSMQIISGETIRARLNREKTIPPARALALAIDLGRVWMAAHAAGVIHRDVKPDNVILEGERVRLIDFGAALLTADYYEQPHLRDVTAVGKRWRTAQVEWIARRRGARRRAVAAANSCARTRTWGERRGRFTPQPRWGRTSRAQNRAASRATPTLTAARS